LAVVERTVTDVLPQRHDTQASTQRFMLTFMASRWLGVGGMIVAIVLKG
jgi:hypothetical protein